MKVQQHHWVIFQIKPWGVLWQHIPKFDLFFLNKSEAQFVTYSTSFRASFELNILVIFAKFAFDGSNISVMPRTFSGSFKSVCATAVNLARKQKIGGKSIYYK